MRIALLGALLVLGALALVPSLRLDGVAMWALEWQRAFQNEIAGSIRALRSGTPGALSALLGAAAACGFVHAAGPGHGKYLIGGVGLGSDVSVTRLAGLASAASLAQAAWAILLVYGGFAVLELPALGLTALAEDYLAIGAVGAVLAWRGARSLARRARDRRPVVTKHGHHGHREGHEPHEHQHDEHHECGCRAHGPSAEEVARTTMPREAIALILGIAVRPCTGAVLLLVIAWQLDLRAAGAAAVVAMGLGTALLTSLVAISSVVVRGVTLASTGRLGVVGVAAPSLQLVAGVSIVGFSLALLGVPPG